MIQDRHQCQYLRQIVQNRLFHRRDALEKWQKRVFIYVAATL